MKRALPAQSPLVDLRFLLSVVPFLGLLFQLLELGGRILHLGEENHRRDDVRLEGCLFIKRVAVAVEYARRNLTVFCRKHP